jgi:hypothetical protein
MEDDDEEQDDDGEDEGLFTVVDASEAREIMNSRERQRRCKATTDPGQEAVNARLGISFVCQVCDGIHHPDKKPEVKIILRGKKAGKYRTTAKPIPEGCAGMIPQTTMLSWIESQALTISAGHGVTAPPVARNYSTKPRDNEGICVALADLDGYIDRKKEEYLSVRKSVMDSLVKTPFMAAPRATQIKREATDEGGCEHARSKVGAVFFGKETVSDCNIADAMFPITNVLQIGAKHADVLDLTEDFRMMLYHVQSRMGTGNGRKNEQYCYTETRSRLAADPRLELFHEHYLMVNTDPVNRDCMVYEVPANVVTIKDAVKLVDAGKARQVR